MKANRLLYILMIAFLFLFFVRCGGQSDLPATELEQPTASTVLPTAEPLPTSSPPLSPTAEPLSTPLPTPPPTAEQPPAAVPPPTIPPCGPPANWVIYTVQVNDTLFSLSRKTNTTVQQIQRANCLNNTTILAGQPLYLPFIPAPPTAEQPPTPLPTATPLPTPLPTAEQPPAPSPTPTTEMPPAPGPGEPRLLIEPFSGPIGTVYTITVDGFQPNENVDIDLILVATEEVVFGFSTAVDEMGRGVVQILSEPGDVTGAYVVRASGDAGSLAFGEFEISE